MSCHTIPPHAGEAQILEQVRERARECAEVLLLSAEDEDDEFEAVDVVHARHRREAARDAAEDVAQEVVLACLVELRGHHPPPAAALRQSVFGVVLGVLGLQAFHEHRRPEADAAHRARTLEGTPEWMDSASQIANWPAETHETREDTHRWLEATHRQQDDTCGRQYEPHEQRDDRHQHQDNPHPDRDVTHHRAA